MEAERCFTNVSPEDFRETEVPGKLDTLYGCVISVDRVNKGERGNSDPGGS